MNSIGHDDEGLKYHHTTADPADNKLTSPPQDEQIRVPAIWVFEVFPPSFISNLRDSADKLGWTQSERVLNPDFLDSIDSMRFRLSGGGWLNLGFIVRDSSQALSMNRQAELPDGVDAIHASILQYIPSTTILAFQFLLDDDTANAIDQPLRETYSTYKERTKDGWRYYNVESQKRLAVDLTRESIRTLCSEWVKNYFPGLYPSGQFDESFPTCEIITFKKDEPYKLIDEKTRHSFLSMLNLNYDYYAWRSQNISGLYLQLYEEKNKDVSKLVLSGNISKILEDNDLKGYVSDTREGQILLWLTALDNTIGKWVLYVLARTYEKQLGVLRDAYGSLDFSRLDSAVSEVQALDRKLLNLQSNLTPFIHELFSVCKKKAYFLHDVYEFFPIAERRKNDRGLFDGLRERLLMLAESLRTNEEQIGAISNRNSQLVSVISNDKLSKTNIRLQRGIFWMTWVLIILTLILVVSEFKDGDFIKNTLQYFSRLIKTH
jgi:hypothetical protein